MLKRIIFLLLITLVSLTAVIEVDVFAIDGMFLDVEIYKIYDDKFNYLFEKDGVVVGDSYLSKDFKYYEVTYVDDNNHTGIAKFVRNVQKPNINNLKSLRSRTSNENLQDRKIAMYMTHNDESYVPTDGVESIYGNGGIKDVALEFKSQLEKYNISVYFDDSLHIPHDTLAYSRSEKTAKALQNKYAPDAIFDIHRDGTSRKFYVTNVNGVERGRVRMVIGKANPNKQLNEEFAMYLMAVGNELYPWLFTDIYYATGHYNQAIDSKAILFEMGSHLCEKELILDSMPELAEVVTTALYKTTVNEDSGSLTINGEETPKDIVVNDVLDNKEEGSASILVMTIIVILLASIFVYALAVLIINLKKSQKIK